jgi:Spy/CpxP family protein refolding chaperone
MNTKTLPLIKYFVAGAVLAVASAFMIGATAAPSGDMGGHGAMMMGGHGRHMDRMLDQVGASPEQRTQIKQIMQAAAGDMKAQRATGQTTRQQMMQLFAQPTIDARAVETLRQQQMAQHDAASKRRVQAMIEAANVLTPDQRQQLAEQMAQRRDMMRRHHHERQNLDAPKAGG